MIAHHVPTWHGHRCRKTFTASMVEAGVDATYRAEKNVSNAETLRLSRYLNCVRNPARKRMLHGYWKHAINGWQARRNPPMSSAVASVYDAAGGPIACGGDSYAMGIANRTLPCGTHVRICYTRCVNTIVFDRGPYIAGRDFDLSRAVQYATGFPDGVATIRYSIQ